jgi:hypothetical protein
MRRLEVAGSGGFGEVFAGAGVDQADAIGFLEGVEEAGHHQVRCMVVGGVDEVEAERLQAVERCWRIEEARALRGGGRVRLAWIGDGSFEVGEDHIRALDQAGDDRHSSGSGLADVGADHGLAGEGNAKLLRPSGRNDKASDGECG